MSGPLREFEIEGMTCAACVGRVERVIQRVPGVQEVSVNLATHRATVAIDAGFDERPLLAAVDAAGFGARPRQVDDPLEPAAVGAASGGRSDVASARVAAALALSIPLAALSMVHALHFRGSGVLQAVLGVGVVLGAGGSILSAALRGARHREVTMDTLVAVGSLAALAMGALRLAREGAHAAHLEFETGAMIVTFVLIGRALEARARRRTGDAVRALVSLRPMIAHVIRGGAERDLPPALLRVGDRVRVRAHERVPVDGVVREGDGWVDVSMLSGESEPVRRAVGDEVIAGTLNGDHPLLIEATRVGGATRLAEIVRRVEAAQGSKAPVQRLADRVAAVFVPAIFAIALATLVAGLLLGSGFEQSALRAVTVLVVACPCALGLATPTAIVVGTGAAAQAGVLLRDAATLERLAKITTVAFDKTGTLTEGRPRLVALWSVEGVSEAELLALVGALEVGASHPIARCVAEEVAARGVEVPVAQGVHSIPGQGVEGLVAGREVRVVAARDEDGARFAAWRESAWTASAVRRDGALIGGFAVADGLRPESEAAVEALRRGGVDVKMLSGDHPRTALAIATRVGIRPDEVHASLSPEAKCDAVSAMRARGEVVAMVGDGVNDAPALAMADVGVAIGSGTDVAAAAAAVTLSRSDPRAVWSAIAWSRATLRVVRQNLAWAFGYNLIAIPLAAFGALDRIGGAMTASAAMAASSVIVVLNALLLRRRLRR